MPKITHRTIFMPEQILTVLDWYIKNAEDNDDFEGFVALQGFRKSITSGFDFDDLMKYLSGGNNEHHQS
jgi:hypothetical protein